MAEQTYSRARFGVLTMLFINVVINYMDRNNMAIAAPEISRSLKLSSVQLGFVFSAFGWAYVTFQLPGGLMTDKISARLLYAISLCLWSVAALIQGFVKGFAVLIGLRMATGMLEAPSYPMNNRIVTDWFPQQERASAIGVYTSGQFLGLALLTPLLTVVQSHWGWRGLFISTGAVGVLWSIIWYVCYHDPVEKPKTELLPAGKAGFKKAFSGRKLWGIYIGQFAVTSTLWFFLTWFPTYLVRYRGLSFLKSGFISSVPFLAAFAGVLVSGFLSDQLMKRGASFGVARKTPVIAGLLLSACIIGANYASDTAWVLFFMTIAFFGNGLASITWVFVSVLSPPKLIGFTGGVFNFIGGLSAIVVPLAIGYLARGGSFTSSILFIGLIAFTGVLAYLFLVGSIKHQRER